MFCLRKSTRTKYCGIDYLKLKNYARFLPNQILYYFVLHILLRYLGHYLNQVKIVHSTIQQCFLKGFHDPISCDHCSDQISDSKSKVG